MKTKVLSVVALVAIGLSTSAFAFGPLGPPTAGLKEGQFGVASEYSYSDSDWKAKVGDTEATIKDVKSDMFIAQPAYGVTDDFEAYALLGVADTKFEDFDGGYKFAYGFGVKLTFEKTENFSWGLMYEMGWKSGSDSNEAGYGTDLDYYDITVALGPTWKANEQLRIYGGPFFYVLRGTLDVDSPSGDTSFKLSEETLVGGYVGAEFDLYTNTSLYAEFQFTGDTMLFGTGINWKF